METMNHLTADAFKTINIGNDSLNDDTIGVTLDTEENHISINIKVEHDLNSGYAYVHPDKVVELIKALSAELAANPKAEVRVYDNYCLY